MLTLFRRTGYLAVLGAGVCLYSGLYRALACTGCGKELRARLTHCCSCAPVLHCLLAGAESGAAAGLECARALRWGPSSCVVELSPTGHTTDSITVTRPRRSCARCLVCCRCGARTPGQPCLSCCGLQVTVTRPTTPSSNQEKPLKPLTT